VITASVADSTAASDSKRIRTRRRSKRSATVPAQGASRSVGAKYENVRTPSSSSDPVRRKTRIAAARFWNHVPLADSAFPAK
jgi:hypothetical protein